ncbi:hypothetical protein BABINDRAFT_162803 [Babjeviella inositovora NRRL Y-12698]|uniref:Vacuolar protein sorting-associated protein 62 n=1 Tax=Babjeviella inositovora NRRL Y-12698 TaxID=984486 RepID=A0A1E3QND3_9ASCO|nr:uncharacterized protein BABINDRAFT_162803 [Babjeviella inositovora NRRL Y-12698]ODQ78602.1 hypothetical protein BABINDRAFT_162803 [Babjeviella inositovora NRRL Y-12698]
MLLLFLLAPLVAAHQLLSAEAELKITNVLRSSTRFRNMPPIVPNPNEMERRLKPGEIPLYVSECAPAIYLYSEEKYMPYDPAQFVKNFHLEFRNGSSVPGGEFPLSLTKLATISKTYCRPIGDETDAGYDINGEDDIFFKSHSDFDGDPAWITGVHNQPDVNDGRLEDAPATVLVVDKGNGWVDAYWFYFYSFNLGPFVMGHGPYGNHVGDWEHSLVRFYEGEPVLVWMSAHGGGAAFEYETMEKYGPNLAKPMKHAGKGNQKFADDSGSHPMKFTEGSLSNTQPVLFSARGTHANYASPGQHPHDLPYAMLNDYADRGSLWNPVLNYLAYTFDGARLTPGNGSVPFREATEYADGRWLFYTGHWGDQTLPMKDPRQHWSVWLKKYIDGPRGPLLKNLLRVSPCQRTKWWNFLLACNIRRYLKYGIGVESDFTGEGECGGVFNLVRPKWLRGIVEQATWGGYFCFVMDLIFG